MICLVNRKSPSRCVSVFWIHVNGIERFREGCRNIVDEYNIPSRHEENCNKMALFTNWLEKEYKDRLMIIVIADEASLFSSKAELSRDKTGADQSILEHLPESPHGLIIIRTRNRAAGVKLTKNCPSGIEVKYYDGIEPPRQVNPVGQHTHR